MSETIEPPRRRRRRSKKKRFSPWTRFVLKIAGWSFVAVGAGYVAFLFAAMINDPRWKEPPYSPATEHTATSDSPPSDKGTPTSTTGSVTANPPDAPERK